MNDSDVNAALDRAQAAVSEGRGLEGTGFWKAVGHVRRDLDAAERFADRIASIDRAAFEAGVKLRVPAWLGTTVLAAGTAAGVAAVAVSGWLEGPPRVVVFSGGFGAILVSSHSLAHWVVGRAVGMRFTHYFLGGPPPPRPGAKLDYATYLRVSPRKRALMHASGAVVTKVVPFALVPAALVMEMPVIAGLLAVVGVGQIVTDVFISTKVSDWKKVRRELRAARAGATQ